MEIIHEEQEQQNGLDAGVDSAEQHQEVQAVADQGNVNQGNVDQGNVDQESVDQESVQLETVEVQEQKTEPEECDLALIQALLFANGEPLAIERLIQSCSCDLPFLVKACEMLQKRLEEEASGLMLVQVGEAYQLRTKPGFSEQIRLLKASAPKRLSNAALETLAIIAYRQPIVKSDVERIRGVDATPTMKTLIERDLIKIVGHQPSVGQPALYGTTDQFLQLFGLSSLEQLPTLRDLKEFDNDPGEEPLADELPQVANA